MRATADTNILVRAAVVDDLDQARQAQDLLRDSELVVLTLSALCEFVWVIARGYRRPAGDIAAAIRALVGSPNVRVDWPAVEAGLAMIDTGGDFADGVIAFDGRRLGAPVFASFDRKAVEFVAAGGGETHLLAPTLD